MKRKLIPVYDRSEIPRFANDEECADFWDTHELTEEYVQKYAYPPDHPRLKLLHKLVPPRPKKQRAT